MAAVFAVEEIKGQKEVYTADKRITTMPDGTVVQEEGIQIKREQMIISRMLEQYYGDWNLKKRELRDKVGEVGLNQANVQVRLLCEDKGRLALSTLKLEFDTAAKAVCEGLLSSGGQSNRSMAECLDTIQQQAIIEKRKEIEEYIAQKETLLSRRPYEVPSPLDLQPKQWTLPYLLEWIYNMCLTSAYLTFGVGLTWSTPVCIRTSLFGCNFTH